MDVKQHFPFETFRPGQEEAIKHICGSLNNNKHFVFEAPTGTGKSVIAFTVGKTLLENIHDNEGPPILILTSTRQLQNQYMETFKQFGAEHIWSARNYECLVHKKSVEKIYYGFKGMCKMKKCAKYNECPYVVQKRKFMKATVGVCNYHYFIHSRFLQPGILICDEAHNLQKILCDNSAIKLSQYSFERIIKSINKTSTQLKVNIDDLMIPFKVLMNYTVQKIEETEFKDYCKQMCELFADWSDILGKEIEDFEDMQRDEVIDMNISSLGKVLDTIDNLNCKMGDFLRSTTKWVVSEMDSKNLSLTVKPLEVTESSKEFETRSRNILFMSATICGAQQYIKELGLETDYDYLELDSPFPIPNRRVYLMPAGSLNYKNRQELIPRFVDKIDYILSRLEQSGEYCGIIHTVSYANADYIDSNSKYKDRMLIPTAEEKMKLNQIIRNKKGCILLSPSMLEGVDLIDDLSRFQIFFKVPYSSLGDRWVKMKQAKDPKWYARDVIVKIIQGTGRSIRTEKDWAWTFIIDGNFLNLLNHHSDLFPKWFRDSIVIYK